MSVNLAVFMQSFLASLRSFGRVHFSKNQTILSTQCGLASTCTTSLASAIDDSGTRRICSFEESNSSSEAVARLAN
jgi:hypothetical protein